MNTNTVKNLFRPVEAKPKGRKVWSIDLESIWLPFFHATNLENVTAIEAESLGAPLRLGYSEDGTVKFSKSGRPVVKIVAEIANSIKLVRENFVAGLAQYSQKVALAQADAYNANIRSSIEAGLPIVARDRDNLSNAIAESEAEALGNVPTEVPATEVKEAELVTA